MIFCLVLVVLHFKVGIYMKTGKLHGFIQDILQFFRMVSLYDMVCTEGLLRYTKRDESNIFSCKYWKSGYGVFFWWKYLYGPVHVKKEFFSSTLWNIPAWSLEWLIVIYISRSR